VERHSCSIGPLMIRPVGSARGKMSETLVSGMIDQGGESFLMPVHIYLLIHGHEVVGRLLPSGLVFPSVHIFPGSSL
jgi:hypothetical protein